jgi:glycosyltransferase involved in cell wall biosynthesis
LFNALAAHLALRAGKRLMVTPHGMLEPWSLGQKKLKKRLGMALYQRSILNRAHCLQATADLEAEHLRSIGLTAPIAVIPNGINWPTRTVDRGKTQGGRRRMLFLSRIHPKKGLMDLVRACGRHRRLLEAGRWRVCVAGSDADGYQKVVQAEVARLGLDGFFDWVGEVDGAEKWRTYRSAQAFVLPTYSENFGLVIAEALACGLPVLTTKGAPWKELLDWRCGWWIEAGQASLDRALPGLLKTPAPRLAEMGRRGQRLIKEHYLWPSAARRLRSTYHWLLDKAGRPDYVRV